MTLDHKSWGHRNTASLKDYMSIEKLILEVTSTIRYRMVDASIKDIFITSVSFTYLNIIQRSIITESHLQESKTTVSVEWFNSLFTFVLHQLRRQHPHKRRHQVRRKDRSNYGGEIQAAGVVAERNRGSNVCLSTLEIPE